MDQIERNAGRCLCIGFSEPQPPEQVLERVRAGEVGGVILFTRNAPSLATLCASTRALAQAAPWPLLLAVDQEGGAVQRVAKGIARWPAMRRLGELGDEALCERVGAAIGEDLRLLGFNVDFAPVLDVVSSDVNTVIGERSFGSDPSEVARLALAVARGLQSARVIACGKHFPGHGGPVADSHLELPLEKRSADELRRVDLLPFAAAVKADLPLLMSAHVLYPSLGAQELPGTLSREVSSDLLREELGYRGVLVSDCLEMRAISDNVRGLCGSDDFGDAALAALMAGVDLLLICHSEARQRAAYRRIVAAARADEAVAARLAAAAARVEKLQARVVPAPPMPADIGAALDPARHAELLAELGAA